MTAILSNISNKPDPNVCDCWGQKFVWTDLHQSAAELRPLTFSYDSLADDCLRRLDEISPRDVPLSQPEKAQDLPKRDLYALLRDHADEDPKLKQLWSEVNTVPDWVDWDQVRRGQDVFYRYGLPILTALNFESLLGGMGSDRVVETLARTGGFSSYVARRRMFETLQFVLQVTNSVESVKPGGDGHASSVRVRFLHATVRQRILELEKQKPGYFDVEKLGVPVNDLDCIGTINTFSTTIIWLGLPRQGVWLREQEIDDYIALWRLIAHYLGTPTEPFESKAKARAMMESLLASQLNPSDMGKVLAKNIVVSLENTAPSFASKEFMEAMARLLNGDQLSDRLDIPQSSLYYRALMFGYCMFVMTFAYTVRLFPAVDQRFIAIRRDRYYKIATDKDTGLGGETMFEFKHVPRLTRTTHLGKRRTSKPAKQGIETLGYLGLFGTVATVGAMCSCVAFFLRPVDLSQIFGRVGDVIQSDSFLKSLTLFG